MKTLEWRTVDKSAWPRGPWDEEPDKMQWRDERTGLACLIVRSHTGALCGYVGVDEQHPLYGVSYSAASETLMPLLRERMEKKVDTDKLGLGQLIELLSDEHAPTPEQVFDVHGGITYSDYCDVSSDPSVGICHVPEQGESDKLFWIGFDAGHCFDVAPAFDRMFDFKPFSREYREVPYMRGEIEKLAVQVAAVTRLMLASPKE